jgi:hypothetical protein
MPAAYPLAGGEAVLRPTLGTIAVPGAFASALEIIRFSAANRLIVEIDYVKETANTPHARSKPIRYAALRRATSCCTPSI